MVTIGRATPGDAGAIAGMLGEIEAHYGSADTRVDVAQVRALLFGDAPVATVLLARDGERVLGMASYSLLWPAAGSQASLYLKELFVRESARRRGVASQLMARVRAAAAEAGCSRVEWTADRTNEAALAFYRSLGLAPHDGKFFYRADRSG